MFQFDIEVHFFLLPVLFALTTIVSQKLHGSLLRKNCSFLYSLTRGEEILESRNVCIEVRFYLLK